MEFVSLKGQLLLDNGRLHGSFFHRTVLLICQHDAEGAFGLVLNRPTGNKVGDALTSNLPESIQANDLFLGGLVELGDSFSATREVKVFAGYAGWSPGQLDDELKRDTWLTHPASIELVFHDQPEALWSMILMQKGWKYRLIAQGPEDLSHN